VQGVFHPKSKFLFDAAMMQCNSACKMRRNIEYSLVPGLTHSPGIDEDQGGPTVINDRNNLWSKLDSQMSGPWKIFYLRREDGFYFNVFSDVGFDDGSGVKGFYGGN
jgi:hypothetical protein